MAALPLLFLDDPEHTLGTQGVDGEERERNTYFISPLPTNVHGVIGAICSFKAVTLLGTKGWEPSGQT